MTLHVYVHVGAIIKEYSKGYSLFVLSMYRITYRNIKLDSPLTTVVVINFNSSSLQIDIRMKVYGKRISNAIHICSHNYVVHIITCVKSDIWSEVYEYCDRNSTIAQDDGRCNFYSFCGMLLRAFQSKTYACVWYIYMMKFSTFIRESSCML